MLYTAPAFARQGVATALLDDLLVLAGAMGAKQITVSASKMAHEFFLGYGFVDQGIESVERQGVQLERHIMKRNVPALQ